MKEYFTGKGIFKLNDIDKHQFIVDKLVYVGLTIDTETGLLINNENLNYKKKEKNDRLSYDRLFQRKNNLEFQTKNEMNILELCGLIENNDEPQGERIKLKDWQVENIIQSIQ